MGLEALHNLFRGLFPKAICEIPISCGATRVGKLHRVFRTLFQRIGVDNAECQFK